MYKLALREPKIPFEEVKTAVMRAGSKNEIKDMIIGLVVHILSPVAMAQKSKLPNTSRTESPRQRERMRLF